MAACDRHGRVSTSNRRVVERIVVRQKRTLAEAPVELGATVEHIRLLLDDADGQVPQPDTTALASAIGTATRGGCSRGVFEREYITAGKALRQISAETGFARPALASTQPPPASHCTRAANHRRSTEPGYTSST